MLDALRDQMFLKIAFLRTFFYRKNLGKIAKESHE